MHIHTPGNPEGQVCKLEIYNLQTILSLSLYLLLSLFQPLLFILHIREKFLIYYVDLKII